MVGSGPFVFLRDEWVPGERTAFRRNPHYVARDEAPDGLAGGKVAKLERVEMLFGADGVAVCSGCGGNVKPDVILFGEMLPVEAIDRARELGASLPDDQPGERWRVLLDPVGHPFCLCPR